VHKYWGLMALASIVYSESEVQVAMEHFGNARTLLN